MSVINQMLQDLDKRHASAQERGNFFQQLRAIPAQHNFGKVKIAMIGALIIVVMISAWWIWNEYKGKKKLVPSVASVPATTPAQSVVPAPIKVANQATKVTETVTTAKSADKKASAATKIKKENIVLASVKATPKKAESKPAPPAEERSESRTEPKAINQASVADKKTMHKPTDASELSAAMVHDQSTDSIDRGKHIERRAKPSTPQQRAESEYQRGSRLLEHGKVREAQEVFNLALKQNPAHDGARQVLLGLLLQEKRIDEAKQLLIEGLQINPKNTSHTMLLARLLVEQGNISGALDILQGNLSNASHSAQYRAFLAALLQRQARHAEAVEQYQAALNIAPANGVWWMGLGISLQAEKLNGRAKEAFNHAKATHNLSPELLAFVEQRLLQLQ